MGRPKFRGEAGEPRSRETNRAALGHRWDEWKRGGAIYPDLAHSHFS